MNLRQLSFNELGFSKLFCDYCVQVKGIATFFQYNPFDPDSLLERNQIQPDLVPGRLKPALEAYNPDELLHENARKNLISLTENPKARTIVTGHQLAIAGGPLFTMFKILTAISESKKVSKKLGDPVVPIFWLADEDQDFDEISSITVPNGSELSTISMSKPVVESQRAGFIPVTEDTASQIDEILKVLPETDFHRDISELLRNAYKVGNTHNEAFGHLILKLFSRFGLLVFGSTRPESRALLGETMSQLIIRSNKIHNALESTSKRLESVYHRQVSISPSNWFVCKPDGSRNKINLEDNIWSASYGQKFSTEELAKIAITDPEFLSPNVFMRPIFQDVLLPNLGIIAGPGEVAYYAQTKEMYNACDLPMPVVIPRFSAMLIEPAIEKSLSELPFNIADFSKRHEDLETEFVQKTQEVDLNAFFDEWSNQIRSLSESKLHVVEEVDPTLIGTLKRIESDQINALNQLKAKLFKALKTKQEVQIKRIHRIQNNLFPGRILQERGLGFIYFLDKYGYNLIDKLLEIVESHGLDSHCIVEL